MGKKRKKKFRGSRRHGRGTKNGRGAGERGGRGNAGLNKHKWTKLAKEDLDYFGPTGFSRPQSLVEEAEVINIFQVEEHLESFIENGFASKDGSLYEVDLSEAGYDKLLAKGKPRKQMKIKIDSSSDKAVSKVESAGGEVVTEE